MDLFLLPLFFVCAMLYASVGHGGASAYLALLALIGYTGGSVVPTVLVMNLTVASRAFTHYYRAGHFSLKCFLPFAMGSVPAAFLGGLIVVSPSVYLFLLSFSLCIAALRMLLIAYEIRPKELPPFFIYLAPLIGGGIGLLSGMIGIGGGIFLSPLLLVLKWADAKRTSAISAAFIAVNSAGGLLGHLLRGTPDLTLWPFMLAAFIGGEWGAHVGARKLLPLLVQRVLGVVLLLAAVKLGMQAMSHHQYTS